MTALLEVHFHGLDKSEAIETRVREKFTKLQKHFDRMSSCRVVLEAPSRSPAKAKVYQVKIEIAVRGGNPLIINHEREGAHAQEELPLAIRDAFDVAIRKADELTRASTTRARSEQSRRRPHNANVGDE